MSTVQSKHFLNTPESLVLHSLHGVCAGNPQLALDPHNKIVFLNNHDLNKVALMCGGGSGHEPAHAGFVGQGMLTGAVCGSVFASPNASQVRRAIDLLDNEKGTVIIVKNYTGDVLNFGLAKEQYAALHPDKASHLRFVIVGDDVAVGREQGKIVGRRGLAGTVLVYKIAGALAHKGASLDEVYNIAQWVAANVATIGVSLGHTHVPGTAPPTTDLAASEIEIGLGIHNESGYQRLSPVPPLSELIPQLMGYLTSTVDPDRSFVPFSGKDEVVLLVNNLGAISELELGGIVAETRRALDVQGLKIARILSGTFMTSLNMPGFSITLLRLPNSTEDTAPSSSLLLSLLDDKPQVPGWKWFSEAPPLSKAAQEVETHKTAEASTKYLHLKAHDSKAFIDSLSRAAKALITAEPDITRMDSIAGDGDCGLTLKVRECNRHLTKAIINVIHLEQAGAEGVLQKIGDGTIDGNNVVRIILYRNPFKSVNPQVHADKYCTF